MTSCHSLLLLALTASSLVSLTTPAVAAADEPAFKIIAHPDMPITSLGRATVAKIFQRAVTGLAGVPKLRPVNLDAASPVRAAFDKVILGKSVSEVKAFWQQQLFAGRSVPPPEKSSEAAVLAFVLATPGAIAYVGARTETGAARIIPLTD
ncbi:MAG: hypothetical protein HY903_20140 [Deltaproteobacteria bacterium]|nr:hypothetical protein [Deltaproteobacteria bacterium]